MFIECHAAYEKSESLNKYVLRRHFDVIWDVIEMYLQIKMISNSRSSEDDEKHPDDIRVW